MPTNIPILRSIKSFAIRSGKLTTRQQEAIDTEWAKYVLPADTQIPWDKIFPSNTRVTLDIGFGMGHSLLQNALNFPDQYFIGIEVYRPGIAALLAEIKTHNINNIRIFHGDAVEILKHRIPDHALDAIHIFFADPWPKRRHHKRRLIQTAFVAQLITKLKTGGRLHLATDWEDYAAHMMRVVSPFTALINTAGENVFSTEKGNRPPTKYEKRGQKLGHGVWDLIFEKVI